MTEQENATASLRAQLADRRDAEAVARQALDRAQASIENEQDVLSAQAGLARTAKDRHALELRILDLQFDQLRLVQQAIVDSTTASDQEKDLARDRLRVLGRLQGLASQKAGRDNQGPLGEYLDTIPRSADEMSEALEGVATNGLASLIDGVSDVSRGFEGLASTVENVANQIVQSLLKIALQKGVEALFSSLFPGAGGGGGSGIGDGGMARGPRLAGARAKGGPVIGGKAYLVGERGPEIFSPPSSGAIIPNDALGAARGGITVNNNFTVPVGLDLATKTEVARFTGYMKQETIRAIRDQDRRRG